MAESDFDVMFITGVGEVFPYIRSHNVLNNLQSTAKDSAHRHVLSRELHPVAGDRERRWTCSAGCTTTNTIVRSTSTMSSV